MKQEERQSSLSSVVFFHGLLYSLSFEIHNIQPWPTLVTYTAQYGSIWSPSDELAYVTCASVLIFINIILSNDVLPTQNTTYCCFATTHSWLKGAWCFYD
jgi:hypothetical protein